MPTSLVLQNDQAAINGIRASGAKQLIIAPGNGYTGGHSWTQASQGDAPSSDYLYMICDPLNNTAIDAGMADDTPDYSTRPRAKIAEARLTGDERRSAVTDRSVANVWSDGSKRMPCKYFKFFGVHVAALGHFQPIMYLGVFPSWRDI